MTWTPGCLTPKALSTERRSPEGSRRVQVQMPARAYRLELEERPQDLSLRCDLRATRPTFCGGAANRERSFGACVSSGSIAARVWTRWRTVEASLRSSVQRPLAYELRVAETTS